MELFEKTLNAMDFLKGKKTALSGAFVVLAFVLNLAFGESDPVDQIGLEQFFWQAFDTLYTIIGAFGVLYGLVFKFLRKVGVIDND